MLSLYDDVGETELRIGDRIFINLKIPRHAYVSISRQGQPLLFGMPDAHRASYRGSLSLDSEPLTFRQRAEKLLNEFGASPKLKLKQISHNVEGVKCFELTERGEE